MAQQKAHVFDLSNPDLVSVYDEVPLWSAPFGLTLLEKVRLKPGMTVLDIGCGTGFPLLELAQRLGDTCRIYGIDPWSAALDRVRLKMRQYEVHNVQLFNDVAENMSFADGLFDLVVSNVGFNNVTDQERVISNCANACKHGAQIILTVNLPDTMNLFYEIFESVLRDAGKDDEVKVMRAHVRAKRRPLEELTFLIEGAGFMISEIIEDAFRMRFLNGTCLLNHYFIRLAFMESWRNILTPTDQDLVFELLEQRLNEVAAREGELSLSIPYACIIGEKS
jgi:ubiquinone/menaquinone biosynthesis C-methylase UbiE